MPPDPSQIHLRLSLVCITFMSFVRGVGGVGGGGGGGWGGALFLSLYFEVV